MVKIALDGMGGDNAPEITVKGALEALKEYDDIYITIFGDEEKMAPYLVPHDRLLVVHTKDYLDMGEKDPIKQFRTNKEHSMFKAMQHVKDGNSDAVVSAGPTQAYIVGGHFIIKKIENVRRVALAPIIPSLDGKGRILLDSGANLDLTPENLLELAIIASVLAKAVLKRDNPTVGLINIGTEEGKGRDQEKETFKLLSESPNVNFFGNIEPRDVLETKADILLSDGFTGNIVVKTMEGTAKSFGRLLKRSIKSSFLSKIGYLFMRKQLKGLNKAMDTSEVGGAMLIGIDGVAIKAHGSSDYIAIRSAIRQAREMVLENAILKVKDILNKS